MNRIFLFFIVFTVSVQLCAQTPEDAIRMSWGAPSGTARNQAIGGAAGSLGGEITSLFVNPAGLGFYKTGEFVLTPGVSILNGKSSYRGTATKSESFSKFNLGLTGFVWSSTNPRSKWSNQSFSIAINRTANFNGRTNYKGENNYSSFSESFAEEFALSGFPIDEYTYSAPLTLGTKLAHYTYLLDTLTTNNGVEIVGVPQRRAILNGGTAALYQEKDIQTKGGITEIAFGYAANMSDKLYLGGSLGIPIVNFERNSFFRETDISGDDANDFNYATYQEDYRSQGVGLNLKLGMIIKPIEKLRLGLALHTPTIYGLKERTTGRMETDLEGYVTGIRVATEDSIYTQFNAAVPEYRYDLVSPWKFMVSGSYVINETEDVTKQKGFITADIEYVTYGSSRFKSANEENDAEYYKGVNEGVKILYKGAMNIRVGGELKFNTLMTRLGFSYYGSPYEDNKELKASRMNISGGLGYRNKGIFADITYVQSLNKDASFPYRLADKANVFANTRNNNGNIILTIGFKF